jgi:hypothetical protein
MPPPIAILRPRDAAMPQINVDATGFDVLHRVKRRQCGTPELMYMLISFFFSSPTPRGAAIVRRSDLAHPAYGWSVHEIRSFSRREYHKRVRRVECSLPKWNG